MVKGGVQVVFDLDNNPRAVMLCYTQDEAEYFCKFLHEHGGRWANGGSYNEDTRFYHCCHGIGYIYNTGQYANASYFLGSRSWTVYHFSDFDWPGFNDGDVVYDDCLDSFILDFIGV